MIPDRYIELMQREIDGVNSNKQSAKLTAYLEQHEQARVFFDELAATANTLRRIERVEPPPQLRQQIVDALPKHRYPRRRKSWLGLLAALPIPDFARKPGFAFAGGLGLGLAAMLLITLLLQPAFVVEERSAAGTLLSQEQAAFTTLFPIEAGDLRGELRWQRAGVVELVLATAAPVEVVIEFEAAGIAGVAAIDGVLPEARISDRTVRIRHQGSRSYRLALVASAEQTPQLICRILREGVPVFEQSIP